MVISVAREEALWLQELEKTLNPACSEAKKGVPNEVTRELNLDR